jgi:hypothetical protein
MPGRSVDAIRKTLDLPCRRVVECEELEVAIVRPLVVDPITELTEFVQPQENYDLPPMNAAKALLEQSSRNGWTLARMNDPMRSWRR